MMFSQVVRNAHIAALQAQKFLDLEAHVPMIVDEVAIYFEHLEDAKRFVGWCETAGADHFNHVHRDGMFQTYGNSEYLVPNYGTGNPDVSTFDVHFDFLQFPNSSFRLEVMVVLDGWAPLHRRMRDGTIAHVSGKVPPKNVFAYEQLCAALGQVVPKQAEYHNSYGQFAYYGLEAPYFKPRVNLSGQ